MKISLDTEDISKLIKTGEGIVLDGQAESALLKLLELQEWVETAVDLAKHNIAEKALEYDPNFSSVQGTKVKIGYRYFGSRYKLDEPNLDKLSVDMYKKTYRYAPIPEKIDEFAKEHNALPLGITTVDRHKQIVIKKIGDFDEPSH